MKWNWLVFRERVWRIWEWWGKLAPDISHVSGQSGLPWGDGKLGTAICQAQWGKDFRAGWCGWDGKCNDMKDLPVFTSNYKPPKGNDLTTTTPQEKNGMGAGFVSVSLLWSTSAISCGDNISNATFLALASVCEALSFPVLGWLSLEWAFWMQNAK